MLGVCLISAEAGKWGMPGTGGVGCPAQCPSGASLLEGVAVEFIFQVALHYLLFFLHWCSVSLKEYLQTSADPCKLQQV